MRVNTLAFGLIGTEFCRKGRGGEEEEGRKNNHIIHELALSERTLTIHSVKAPSYLLKGQRGDSARVTDFNRVGRIIFGFELL